MRSVHCSDTLTCKLNHVYVAYLDLTWSLVVLAERLR